MPVCSKPRPVVASKVPVRGLHMATAMKTFTRAELAQNVGSRFAEDNRPSSDTMLIAIDNYVYDVTKFAALHPGGKAVLRMVAGEDATKQFYGLHNQDVIEKYHKRLCVGVLRGIS